jgi:hypothetical protein
MIGWNDLTEEWQIVVLVVLLVLAAFLLWG